MLKPTGSLDLRRLTYSLALESPASKWVSPFCWGTCLAAFSRWKLKKTKRPRKRDSPVLRLITREGFRSALTTPAADRLGMGRVDILGRVRERERSVGLQRGRRPWKDWWWRAVAVAVAVADENVGAEKKAEDAIGIWVWVRES